MVLILLFLFININIASADVYINIDDTTNPENDVLYTTDYGDYTCTHDMNFSSVTAYPTMVTFNSSYFQQNTTGLNKIHYLATNVSQITTVGVLCISFYSDISGPTQFNVSGLHNGHRYKIERDGGIISSPTSSTGGVVRFNSDALGEHLYEITYDEEPPVDLGIGQYTWDLINLMFLLVILSMMIRLREEWF